MFFRADTLAGAFAYIGAMFTGGGANTVAILMTKKTGYAVIAGLVCSLPVLKIFGKIETKTPRMNAAVSVVKESVGTLLALILLALCMVFLAGSTYNPFIYFRF